MKKAVVLAAGPGTRLQDFGLELPKPLVKILGVNLLERQLRCLASIKEIGEVIVVIGCSSKAVKDGIDALGEWRFVLRVVENSKWQLGNGTSLEAARGVLEGCPFFVLMVDHVFDPITLEHFAKECGSDLALSVFEGEDERLDLDEATKVWVDGEGFVRKIGKELKKFTGVDMGLFSLDERIFPALKYAFQDGDYSLTGGVNRLIAKSSLHAMLTRDTWFDIDTNDDYRHALQHLKSKNITGEQRDT
jgi:CDP-L-myo-inositol myo-inositolphosphotransferase